MTVAETQINALSNIGQGRLESNSSFTTTNNDLEAKICPSTLEDLLNSISSPTALQAKFSNEREGNQNHAVSKVEVDHISPGSSSQPAGHGLDKKCSVLDAGNIQKSSEMMDLSKDESPLNTSFGYQISDNEMDYIMRLTISDPERAVLEWMDIKSKDLERQLRTKTRKLSIKSLSLQVSRNKVVTLPESIPFLQIVSQRTPMSLILILPEIRLRIRTWW